MSNSVSADIAKEKMYAVVKPKLPEQQQEQQKEVLVKQDPSLSGIQWAYQADPAAQNPAQVNPNLNAQGKNVQARGEFEIAQLGEEDLAVLSTTVSIHNKSVSAPKGKSLIHATRLGLNAAALEESFRELYKKSRSHNLLLERFMAHVKFNTIKMLCSVLGMSAQEQDRVQSEVRQEALAEIDTKLKQDWAYSKALLEIVG
ncbi:MAG: hypothetical protein V3T21_04660 [Candidatus Margulisiibacteriota bacterium]